MTNRTRRNSFSSDAVSLFSEGELTFERVCTKHDITKDLRSSAQLPQPGRAELSSIHDLYA